MLEAMHPTSMPTADLEDLPGHFIRRLQQIAVAVFLQETQAFGVTPVQYAALQVICRAPGIDQRTLSSVIGLDTSTTGGVVDRLETRGLLRRSPSDYDRRVRLLTPTEDGAAMVQSIEPQMLRAQERILSPLPKHERAEFMRMIKVLVQANNELSRAPSQA